MAEPRELLLIFDATGVSADVLESQRVTQQMSPRVVIIESEAPRDELQAMQGVQAVLEPGESAAEEVRNTLTSAEDLFVAAYTQRARAKERPGEGLNWDAEGFLPPDPPQRR